MPNFNDLTLRRFGRWRVLTRAANKGRTTFWKCRCACGTKRNVFAGSLTRGVSLSCGCLRSEMAKTRIVSAEMRAALAKRRTTHGFTIGHSRTPEYRTWCSMKNRCCNKNSLDWKDYGGRGIAVSAKWQGRNGFQNFLNHVGLKPSSRHSLDRFPDNDGNYEPGNVRWATPVEQVENRRVKRIENFSDDVINLEFYRRTDLRFMAVYMKGLAEAA